jgi:hypothetical protein
MADPVQVDIVPQVATLTDSTGTVPPAPNTVGLNAVPYTLAGDALTAGVTFENTGEEIVLFRKSSTSELIITADVPNACSQGYKTEHDVVAHVQAGNVTPTWKVLGRFQKSRYNTTRTAGANRVLLTFSGGTDTVELLVIRAPQVGE